MSNRVMDYAITEDAFLALLQGMDGRTRFRLAGLPESPRLLGVSHDWERRAFRVRIESPWHAEVPDGDVVPWGEWRVEAERGGGVFERDFFRDCANLGSIRRRVEQDQPVIHWAPPEGAIHDRRDLLTAYDACVAECQRLSAELVGLRSVFANDMLDESAVAREAYAQGWRDCQRQAAIKTGATP